MTTLAALIAAVAKSAGAGGALAYAIMYGLALLLACFSMFAVLFLISWSISSLWHSADLDQQNNSKSPFAEGQLPPQVLPPRNPSS